MRIPTRHLGKNAVIALALLAAGFFVAWLRFRAYLGDEGAFSDGARTYDPGEAGAVRYAVWEAPEVLGESINTGASESHPALSPDGRWFVFVVGERGMNSELYVAEMRGGKPFDPRPLSALNGPADECSPAFADDCLYFASDRPGGAGGLDLYRAPYVDGEFGAPERLNDAINSPSDDCDPAPRPGTRELVFASNRRGPNFDLYLATLPAQDEALAAVPAGRAVSPGPSQPPEPIDALNSPADEREPAFTADGRTLFLASDRGNKGSDFDLYRSARSNDAWSAPVPLVGLNTPASERSPMPVSDDFSLYFARNLGTNGLDLLHARSIELFRLPGRPVGWVDLATLGALLLLSLLAWLAKRWPKLETIYKCYLVSLLVHLLLLWWSQGLGVLGGGAPRGRRPDAIRVKIAPNSSASSGSISASSRERGGRLEGEAATHATGSAEPERFAAEVPLGSGSAPRNIVEAPDALVPAIPARGSAGIESAMPMTSGMSGTSGTSGTSGSPAVAIPLADRGEVVRRSDTAPGLGLAAASTGSARSSTSADSGPGRGSPSGVGGGLEAPSASTSVGPPSAPAPGAPTRGEAALAPGTQNASSKSVAVASPQEERSRGSGSGAGSVAGLSLDALDAVGGERAAGAAPERGRAAARGLGAGGASTSLPSDRIGGDSIGGGWISALAPKAPAEAAPAATHGSSDLGPSTAPQAGIGLHDAETTTKKIVASSPAKPTGSSDVLDALAGSTGSPPRAVEAAPEKRSFAREKTSTAPAPPALALDVPEDRPRSEPPRPEKRWENTPYRNREGEDKSRALELNGGSQETEAAVASGLAYLARIQRSNGGWGDDEELDEKYGQVAIGKSGLALLAFLGAGHTHASRTEYSENVARAIGFLLARQDEGSGHLGDSDAYSHGIATYALAECYALTEEMQLREPLERAVAHILAKQNHPRDPKRFGGWSYYYLDDRVFDRWPRTSITAWQVMALESARLGGLSVPEKAFDDAATFIDHAEDPEHGWYRYNHDPSRLNSAWPTLPASTPAALFALSLMGRDILSEDYAQSREFVLSRAPREYRRGSENEFVQRGQGNLYFWYYGTLAMFRAGGNAWQRWNVAMKETLVRGQRKDGSWAPIDVYCKYARDGEGDLSYSTAMCVLSLEVYYRYYLPLLKVK